VNATQMMRISASIASPGGSVRRDRLRYLNGRHEATARAPVTLSLDISPIKIALAVGS
jgi:hypothetical protein